MTARQTDTEALILVTGGKKAVRLWVERHDVRGQDVRKTNKKWSSTRMREDVQDACGP